MKEKAYYSNDICIVGLGCVLPDANNPAEFWKNLLAGKCAIRKIPEERGKSRLYFSPDKNESDKTYSNVAAFIENKRLRTLAKSLGLDFDKHSRLQIMALEAARQALGGVNSQTLDRVKKNTSVFLGCMELDETLILEKIFLYNESIRPFKGHIEKSGLKDGERIYEAIRKHFYKKNKVDEKTKVTSVLPTSAIDLIKKRFNLKGEGALLDAACASSMAALDAAVNSLINYETDLAISGGIEGNLGPDTFVLFSKVGALSTGACRPFDKKADGLSQGEGSVIFVLQRLADALLDKSKIYGVIRAVGGSSDGRHSSLFSPSFEGQILAYQRAYEGLDKNKVDYIECHGTGTKTGDAMEIKSLNDFFHGKRIPIGSVKSLIGHTKGAAGAAGLLKCALMLANKIIPPSKHIESPLVFPDGAVYLNKKSISVLRQEKSWRLGISSFGFGNINYHLVLDEFENSKPVKSEIGRAEADKIVVVGRGLAPAGKINEASLAAKFKIPPQSLPSIDRIQIEALMAAADAFEKANIDIVRSNKEKVSVIAASSLGLDFGLALVERVRYFEFNDALGFLDKKSLDTMISVKNRLPKITEDTGHGVLNNVIAGRICNTFDFKGKNFNVDADFNSLPAALNIAVRELRVRAGLVVLIFCDEKLHETKTRVLKTNIACLLLSTLEEAKKENYPIQEVISQITYHE